MEEHPLSESAWRRGWQDTKAVWKSWQFYVFDAIGGFVVGGVFEWYWGLAFVVFGMICVWMGATVRAPIKQRNEARTLLQKRKVPIPLRNRDELIRAIAEAQQAAMNLIYRQESLDKTKELSPWIANTVRMASVDAAYSRYQNAMEKLRQEKLVAGDAFELPILRLTTFIMGQVFRKMEKPIQIGGDKPLVLTAEEFTAKLDEKVDEVIREINEISGQVPDKGDSQKSDN